MLQANTHIHTLGVSRAGAGTRLWLEGKRLLNHGFAHKVACERIWSQGKLVIRPVDSDAWAKLERANRTTIAGTVDRPIIDITGAIVAACFPTGQVMVTWSHNQITIDGVAPATLTCHWCGTVNDRTSESCQHCNGV